MSETRPPFLESKDPGKPQSNRVQKLLGKPTGGGQGCSWKGLVSFLSASCVPGTCYTCILMTTKDPRMLCAAVQAEAAAVAWAPED